MDKVVLGFSGGLGTTAALHLLRRRFGPNVTTFTANLGQQGSTEALCERAIQLGAGSAQIADLRERFAREFVWPALRAGAICDSGYALAHALARPLVVAQLTEIAIEEGAQYVAHGCASKSNDQVRFEVSAAALAPDLAVLSPLREHDLLRLDEVAAYCNRNRISTSGEGRFSITENLLGTSVQWDRAPDSFDDVPEEVWRKTRPLSETPDEPEELLLHFERGVPTAIDGSDTGPVELLELVGNKGGEHGLGRLVTAEDRLIGIKMIEVYEQPAAEILHTARRALQRIVLSGGLLEYLPHASRTYADLVFKGLWFSELRQALDAFFLKANEYVTGDVRLSLHKGHCRVLGVRSPNSLYSQALAEPTTQGDAFAHKAVRGYLDTLRQAAVPREGAKKP